MDGVVSGVAADGIDAVAFVVVVGGITASPHCHRHHHHYNHNGVVEVGGGGV